MTNAAPRLAAHEIVPRGPLRHSAARARTRSRLNDKLGDFSFMHSSEAQTIKPTTDGPLCAKDHTDLLGIFHL